MRYLAASLVIYATTGSLAVAGDLLLEPHGLQRDRTVEIVYRLDATTDRRGVLNIESTDSLGQFMDQFETPLSVASASRVVGPLNLKRAMDSRNELRARLSSDRIGQGGAANPRESDTHLSLSTSPPGEPWRDYQIIIWQGQTAQQYAALRKIGVTAGAVHLEDKEHPEQMPDAQIETLLRNRLHWYIENIATDFYSPYHRWSPDRPANWRFQEVKQLYQEDPLDAAAFIRNPSLSDQEWLRRIRDRLDRVVRAQDVYRPLYYNLADEPGIADLSIFWDFDFSEQSLAGFRKWLRQHYGSLAALNHQWGSHFGRWAFVMPMTTREAIARSDDNYSAWADFKGWMDEAFARALRAGTDAVHNARPGAIAAIEGGQIPGWGGYDYSRLAHTVDVMELYDGGGNLEIVRSLNPSVVILTTSSGSGPAEAHQTWRELLRGARGLILWDPNSDFVHENGTLGFRAREAIGYLGEIRAGLGALLINSARTVDPIAILYSPPSMRTQWLLDWKPKGDAWSRRDIGSSYEDANPVRSSMIAYSEMVEHLGFHPRFLSPDLIARGELESDHYRVLILPRAISLDPREAREIRRFVKRGGVVIADSEPGAFDSHSRRLARGALVDLFRRTGDAAGASLLVGKGKAIYVAGDAASCPGVRAPDPCNHLVKELKRIFQEQNIKPTIAITAQNGEPLSDVERYVFHNGGVTIIGIQRDLRKSAGTQRTGGDASGERIFLTLPRRSFAYDLRNRRALGQTNRVNIALDPIEPTLLALSPMPLPHLSVRGPANVHAGETAEFRFSYAGRSVASVDVLHIDVVDPSGDIVLPYSGNVLTTRGTASLRLPFARNDPSGNWTIRVTDLPSTETITFLLKVARNQGDVNSWPAPPIRAEVAAMWTHLPRESRAGRHL